MALIHSLAIILATTVFVSFIIGVCSMPIWVRRSAKDALLELADKKPEGGVAIIRELAADPASSLADQGVTQSSDVLTEHPSAESFYGQLKVSEEIDDNAYMAESITDDDYAMPQSSTGGCDIAGEERDWSMFETPTYLRGKLQASDGTIVPLH